LRFAFAGMRPVWSRFLGAGSLFRAALFLSVEGRNPHNHPALSNPAASL
jgi:hypothetical protein